MTATEAESLIKPSNRTDLKVVRQISSKMVLDSPSIHPEESTDNKYKPRPWSLRIICMEQNILAVFFLGLAVASFVIVGIDGDNSCQDTDSLFLKLSSYLLSGGVVCMTWVLFAICIIYVVKTGKERLLAESAMIIYSIAIFGICFALFQIVWTIIGWILWSKSNHCNGQMIGYMQLWYLIIICCIIFWKSPLRKWIVNFFKKCWRVL